MWGSSQYCCFWWDFFCGCCLNSSGTLWAIAPFSHIWDPADIIVLWERNIMDKDENKKETLEDLHTAMISETAGQWKMWQQTPCIGGMKKWKTVLRTFKALQWKCEMYLLTIYSSIAWQIFKDKNVALTSILCKNRYMQS